jgi:hypothetical protein
METFTAIQEYMKDNSDVYPEFKGKEIEQSGFFF